MLAQCPKVFWDPWKSFYILLNMHTHTWAQLRCLVIGWAFITPETKTPHQTQSRKHKGKQRFGINHSTSQAAVHSWQNTIFQLILIDKSIGHFSAIDTGKKPIKLDRSSLHGLITSALCFCCLSSIRFDSLKKSCRCASHRRQSVVLDAILPNWSRMPMG